MSYFKKKLGGGSKLEDRIAPAFLGGGEIEGFEGISDTSEETETPVSRAISDEGIEGAYGNVHPSGLDGMEGFEGDFGSETEAHEHESDLETEHYDPFHIGDLGAPESVVNEITEDTQGIFYDLLGDGFDEAEANEIASEVAKGLAQSFNDAFLDQIDPSESQDG